MVGPSSKFVYAMAADSGSSGPGLARLESDAGACWQAAAHDHHDHVIMTLALWHSAAHCKWHAHELNLLMMSNVLSSSSSMRLRMLALACARVRTRAELEHRCGFLMMNRSDSAAESLVSS